MVRLVVDGTAFARRAIEGVTAEEFARLHEDSCFRELPLEARRRKLAAVHRFMMDKLKVEEGEARDASPVV